MKHFRLLIALALLTFGQLAHAGLVQSVKASVSGGAGTVSLSGVNSSSTLVLLEFYTGASANTSPSTPTGYSVASAPGWFFSGGASCNTGIFYKTSPSSGTNSVTISNPSGGSGYAVLTEWNGMTATPLDTTPAAATSTATTSGSTSISSGTLAQASEVLFVVLSENTAGAGLTNTSLTTPTGFTDLYKNVDSNGDWTYDFAYQVVSATTSVTASYTWTDSTGATTISQSNMDSFRLSGGPSPGTLGASVGLGFP